MRSSYLENKLGEILKTYVIGWRQNPPYVELGVLDGYSTSCIAEGLKELDRLYGYKFKLDAYDLFEDYPYKHGNQEEVQAMLKEKGLENYVNLQKGDAYKVAQNYADKSLEFLHVDISNTGQVIKDIMEVWHPKMRDKGFIFFEGGSKERDQVEWMTKYNMPSIRKEIDTNPIINTYYWYGTYFEYPSMTVLLRKWWM